MHKKIILITFLTIFSQTAICWKYFTFEYWIPGILGFLSLSSCSIAEYRNNDLELFKEQQHGLHKNAELKANSVCWKIKHHCLDGFRGALNVCYESEFNSNIACRHTCKGESSCISKCNSKHTFNNCAKVENLENIKASKKYSKESFQKYCSKHAPPEPCSSLAKKIKRYTRIIDEQQCSK